MARTLRPAQARGKALPRLIFFTDPERTPDPAAVMGRLPRGAGVVYRPFGDPDAARVGRRLRTAAHRRGLVFLVGADAGLAARVAADGVHLPERAAWRARGLRRGRRGWLMTAAAHSRSAIIAARRAGADAAIVSAVFPSASPSAGPAIGAVRFAQLVRGAGLAVYALGGVNSITARRLTRSGAAGFAAIEGLL
ncbi:MAG TPA: thiamine phosphate synthase [Caulobacteraceae bacterium]|nr:thiamine phosphate synthase [Caulobacteraceae bacterium]